MKRGRASSPDLKRTPVIASTLAAATPVLSRRDGVLYSHLEDTAAYYRSQTQFGLVGYPQNNTRKFDSFVPANGFVKKDREADGLASLS